MTGLSVVIPAFNAERYVRGAVASAVAAGADEVLVVDDGSTDGTARVASAAGAQVLIQVNAGASAARTRGAVAAAHPLLVFLDADDELIGDGVRASIELLALHPDAVAVGGLVVGLLPGGRETLLARPPDRDLTVAGMLRTGHGPWPPAAAVVRSSAYQAAGQVQPERLCTAYAEDYELLLRLASVGPVLSHQTPAARYRMHVGKSSRNAGAPLRAKEEIRRHYARHLGLEIDLLGGRELRAAILMRRARFARAHDRLAAASAFASAAALLRPVHSVQRVAAGALR